MRSHRRTARQGAQNESPIDARAPYEALFAQGTALAERLAHAHGRERSLLATQLDRLFSARVSALRRTENFATLDEVMPSLSAIAQRERERKTTGATAKIREAFQFADDRPAHAKQHDADAALRRMFGVERYEPALRPEELPAYQQARRAVLERLGVKILEGDTELQYSNRLAVAKEGFIVQLTHDALPSGGLPGAERISGVTALLDVNGQARGQVAAYHRGKWIQRITDASLQRIFDEIAAAIG
jgi:hypothetical protein